MYTCAYLLTARLEMDALRLKGEREREKERMMTEEGLQVIVSHVGLVDGAEGAYHIGLMRVSDSPFGKSMVGNIDMRTSLSGLRLTTQLEIIAWNVASPSPASPSFSIYPFRNSTLDFR